MNSLVANHKLANSKTFLFSFHLPQWSQAESSVALHINGVKYIWKNRIIEYLLCIILSVPGSVNKISVFK